jgi:hypothetical protein
MPIQNVLEGDKPKFGWPGLCHVDRASITTVDDQARIGRLLLPLLQYL